jgi:hypothetical protein
MAKSTISRYDGNINDLAFDIFALKFKNQAELLNMIAEQYAKNADCDEMARAGVLIGMAAKEIGVLKNE